MTFKFWFGVLLVAFAAGQVDRKSLAAGFWPISTGEFDPLAGDVLVAQADFNQDRLYTSINAAPILSLSTQRLKLGSIFTCGTPLFVLQKRLRTVRQERPSCDAEPHNRVSVAWYGD